MVIMRFSTLDEWLAWQETQHSKKIDLGLERCCPVLYRMGLERPPHAVITVAGTNGKGSSVAFLEAILMAAGYRVGAYSSPHLLRYNERVRVNGVEVADAELCLAFERIDRSRGDLSLSYFEFGTLAAFDIFHRAGLDVAVLEVGMGGRLDAVNMLDPDIALISAIGIDHVSTLGADRESIAKEKAGILRARRPAVCGDPEPPRCLLARAEALQVPLYCLERDFGYEAQPKTWSWWGGTQRLDHLPHPRLRGGFQLRNAAAVLMALEAMAVRLPVSRQAIAQGLTDVRLHGRFQVLPGAVTRIFDVAHNPQGAEALAATLRSEPCAGRTLAVFAMLADKDTEGVARVMQEVVDVWHAAGLSVDRGASGEHLARQLKALGAVRAYTHNSVTEAYKEALAGAQAGDRVIIFGSFYTVAEALQHA